MKFLIPLFLVVACTSASDDVDVDETTTPPTTTENPTGPTTDPDPWFCTEATPTVTPNGLYQDVETEHYRMSLAVTPERAEELGRFAEAAYAAMADRFGAEPTDLPLEVNLYPDVAAFEAAIRADGLTPPSGAGGYYHPSSKTAYVLAAPTQYYEDTILLHEMLHQFHYLSRTGNVNVPTWYAEGLAEAWSRHDWDLECLRLGRIPLLTQEDAYDQALDELSGGLALSSRARCPAARSAWPSSNISTAPTPKTSPASGRPWTTTPPTRSASSRPSSGMPISSPRTSPPGSPTTRSP